MSIEITYEPPGDNRLCTCILGDFGLELADPECGPHRPGHDWD